MSQIAVVDCGMGNLHSVVAGVRRVAPAAEVITTDDGDSIARADKIIFPGDGHFDACMCEIDQRGLRAPLLQAALNKPFLGICVGMQVLFAASEEGDLPGLGVFAETIRHLPAGDGRKIPHIGWNTTHHQHPHLVTADIPDETRFYFIHTYYAPLGEWTLMSAFYGVEFSAVIGTDKLLATQFHPEKSGTGGLRLLQQFICQ